MRIGLKIYLALALYLSVSLSAVDFGEFMNETCEEVDGGWNCPELNFEFDVPITFSDNISCYAEPGVTSCSDDCSQVVLLCSSTVRFPENTYLTLKYKRVLSQTNFENMSTEILFLASQDYEAAISPEAVDFSRCTQEFDEEFSTLFLTCPTYNGKSYLSGLSILPDFLIIFDLEEIEGVDVGSFLYNNLVYIILAVIIITMLIWIIKSKGRR